MRPLPDPRPPASSASDRARRLRALYVRELDFVWTVLSRLGVDDVDLEDTAHEVFMVVHRQLEQFEGRSSVRTWLYAIARRIAWRHCRTERRRARRHRALAAEPRAVASGSDMDDALCAREARERLAAFLETLDRPKREAFVLGELEALSRTALGRALGVSPGTAYSRLRAARADFAATFGPDGPWGLGVSRHARAHEAAPPKARQRLWLALPGGLGATTSASGLLAGGITLAIGMGLLGVVAAVVPSRAGRPRMTSDAVAATRPEPERVRERDESAELRPPNPAEASRELTRSPATVASTRQARPEPVRTTASRQRTTSVRSPASSIEPAALRVQGVAPPTSTTAADPSGDLAEEAALLAKAREAMRARHWTEARAHLERHAERFPSGLLDVERRASTLIVSCAQGRRADALAEARVLASSRVPETLRASLRSSCVGERFDRG